MTSHDAIRACDPRSISRLELEQFIVDALFAYNDHATAERLFLELKHRNLAPAVGPNTAG